MDNTQPVMIEMPEGTKTWYLDGKFHRDDGPAIIAIHGDTWWYLDGKLHRTDGPAIDYPDGTKQWYHQGSRHRTDGPAVEYPDGSKSWWLRGYWQPNFDLWLDQNTELTGEEKVMMKLKYG
jgi:hypothetical protein|tara:strand:+ start:291 stop:653 length:363 start_codon:yes stop_codon:yes gene_type:complete